MWWKSIFKRLVYTPPDLSPRFTCKVTWSCLIFYFGHPFRQRNATCKLAATEDYRVFHKIIFRGCSIIHSLSNGVVGELSINLINLRWLVVGCSIIHSLSNGVVGELSINLIKLRWLATGLLCLERTCFSGLIYSDRTWLLFWVYM